jgi:putative ABC transport system substrate-binding protein
VDVLVASATDVGRIKSATSSIPVVFSMGGDPVASGLVASLARPGGNLTGATFLASVVAPKMAEVLHETAPSAAMAWLFNSTNGESETQARQFDEAARLLSVKLDHISVTNEHDIDMAFETLVERHTGALVIQGDPLFTDYLNQLVALTLHHGIAAIYQSRIFPEAGGLMSYGGSLEEASRIAGTYVGRILKGEKPSDLPVQQSTKVELVINLKTAKALGLTIPLALRGRADEVIE